MSNIVEVPAIGEQELPPEAVTDGKLDMILSGLLIPSQGMGKALAREIARLRAKLNLSGK